MICKIEICRKSENGKIADTYLRMLVVLLRMRQFLLFDMQIKQREVSTVRSHAWRQ